MAWKKFTNDAGVVEYSCLSTDVKPVVDTQDAEGILEGSRLTEIQSDGSLKIYNFYQGGWRGGWAVPENFLNIADAHMALGSDATGDIYYRNASGKLTRLALGTAGQVLTSNGTLPVWATPDANAPTLSATSASNLAATTATLNFTSDEAGTYYYLVYAAADAAPNAATIKAQGTAVAKGTSAAIAGANTANVTGLTTATEYKAYVLVADAAGNNSEITTINVTTT